MLAILFLFVCVCFPLPPVCFFLFLFSSFCFLFFVLFLSFRCVFTIFVTQVSLFWSQTSLGSWNPRNSHLRTPPPFANTSGLRNTLETDFGCQRKQVTNSKTPGPTWWLKIRDPGPQIVDFLVFQPKQACPPKIRTPTHGSFLRVPNGGNPNPSCWNSIVYTPQKGTKSLTSPVRTNPEHPKTARSPKKNHTQILSFFLPNVSEQGWGIPEATAGTAGPAFALA